MTLRITAVICLRLVLSATAIGAEPLRIPILVENSSKEAAEAAPVSAGIPFARRTLADVKTLALSGADGKAVPLQAQCLSRWPDGSCRWVLVDFQASLVAGGRSELSLSVGGNQMPVADPVKIAGGAGKVAFDNGRLKFSIAKGSTFASLSSSDSKAGAEITSTVVIGPKEKQITSKTLVDSLEVYAKGPIRAAVSISGRRIYSDGREGPFSQRVEMFAGSPYLRVEDTFVYSHFPGTHAKPENPLGRWALEINPTGDAQRLVMAPLIAAEEAEGLVVKDASVAFWGLEKPFELSRHTDEELLGEDTPGIALGLGKSCAVAIGIRPESKKSIEKGFPSRGLRAHTLPQVYAASGRSAILPRKYRDNSSKPRRG
jgi:hypothetical protein